MEISSSRAVALMESRPVWGAWIEIKLTESVINTTEVAPRMGRVD